jgi:cell division protein ZapE
MISVLERYRVLVAAGELKADDEQAFAAQRLDQLQKELEAAPPKVGVVERLFKRDQVKAPRGLYIWGNVGRGKSMLMDLFHSCLNIPLKRRAHFHEFMIEVHARLRVERAKESSQWSQLLHKRPNACALTKWSSTTRPMR